MSDSRKHPVENQENYPWKSAEAIFRTCTHFDNTDSLCAGCLTKAIADARAAGYAEAIEKAAKVADRYRIGADEQGGIRARCIAEDIRALAPADKEKPPSCEACSNAIGGTCWAHRK